jgi:hypothetical protein
MGTPIITQADLDQFKEDVINELRLLMAKEKTVKTKWIKNDRGKKNASSKPHYSSDSASQWHTQLHKNWGHPLLRCRRN